MNIKNLRKQRKASKGVTLIALVITIVVLIILAEITIGSLTGDNSVIKNARDASGKTEIAVEEEQIEAAIIKAEQKHRNTQLEDVIEELKASKIITNESQVDKETGHIKTDAGNEVEGKLDNYVGVLARDIANSENKGKYYGATVTGYECKNGEAVNSWRIFYADQENIYIIADNAINPEYAPKSKLNNALAIGEDGISVHFNPIRNDYEGIKDIEEQSLAKKWLSKLLNTKTNPSNAQKVVAYMMDTNVWSVFAGNSAEYAIAGPTVEMFCSSYQETHPDKYIVCDIGSQGNGYVAKWNDDSDESEKYVYNILCGEFGGIYSKEKGESFWLSSPYNGNDLIMRVGSHTEEGEWTANLDSYWFHSNAGLLRPVVCLKTNVKLQKVGDGATYKIKK